jgi:hypothetical protein
MVVGTGHGDGAEAVTVTVCRNSPAALSEIGSTGHHDTDNEQASRTTGTTPVSSTAFVPDRTDHAWFDASGHDVAVPAGSTPV